MMTDIQVRLASVEDIPTLKVHEAHPNARFAEQHFERQQAGDYYLAVAFDEETLVGTCVLDCSADNPLAPELKSLWVYPEHRRKGAARALTHYMEQQSAKLGFVEVFLRINPNDPDAIPTYISFDYRPTGDHFETAYEWVDAEGTRYSRFQDDAVYRKSLLAR
ncbi:MAG: GNAT family N-acetyltransferase [Propionibacteriaceae bacterium]|jgi:GNAT superfamily N-acetyltransferase|nr:GNAT family N-acetyltransferase [Propionibacteriaceae bacterium]